MSELFILRNGKSVVYANGSEEVTIEDVKKAYEKGLLNDDVTLEGTVYSRSDVFLSHWMERL